MTDLTRSLTIQSLSHDMTAEARVSELDSHAEMINTALYDNNVWTIKLNVGTNLDATYFLLLNQAESQIKRKHRDIKESQSKTQRHYFADR